MGSLTDLALGSRVVLRPYGVAAAVANLLYYQVLPSPDFKIVRACFVVLLNGHQSVSLGILPFFFDGSSLHFRG